MYPRKKNNSKKIFLAIILLAVLIGATAAIVYYTSATGARPVNVGVHVGDTFTYAMKGTASLQGLDAVVPDDLYRFNETDYYKLTITDINGSKVTTNTQWRFLNGTEVNDSGWIDLSDGAKSNDGTFWTLYASNLNVGEYLRPNGMDYVTVNDTDTFTYADSVRQRNLFKMENEFRDIRDPTGSTLRYDYLTVHFDKETGMFQNMVNYESYNNPQMTIVKTWTLVNSTVWRVK
jgi:hypothetical protein